MHFWLKLQALVTSNPKSRRSRSNSHGFKSRVAQLETLEQRQTFAADGISIDTQRFDTSHVLVQVADSNPAAIRNLIQSPSRMEAITSDGWYRVAVAPGPNGRFDITTIHRAVRGAQCQPRFSHSCHSNAK